MRLTYVASIEVMAVSLLSCASPGNGMQLDPDRALHDWQLQRLMQPSPRDLDKEHTGYVYVYDGLSEREVDTALKIHFPRIQNMMFVGTVKTDARGEPLQDAASGKYAQESRGCSN
jgi:hypothetical protein